MLRRKSQSDKRHANTTFTWLTNALRLWNKGFYAFNKYMLYYSYQKFSRIGEWLAQDSEQRRIPGFFLNAPWLSLLTVVATLVSTTIIHLNIDHTTCQVGCLYVAIWWMDNNND